MGIFDEPKKEAVKLYCPRCGDVYNTVSPYGGERECCIGPGLSRQKNLFPRRFRSVSRTCDWLDPETITACTTSVVVFPPRYCIITPDYVFFQNRFSRKAKKYALPKEDGYGHIWTRSFQRQQHHSFFWRKSSLKNAIAVKGVIYNVMYPGEWPDTTVASMDRTVDRRYNIPSVVVCTQP